MSYVQRVLQPGETVTAVGRLHWIVYRKAIAALILAVVLFAVAKTTPGLTRNTAGTINISASSLSSSPSGSPQRLVRPLDHRDRSDQPARDLQARLHQALHR